ncbi:DNA repair protein RecN [Janibacter sp. GXQ6167]|uniref:DNA repair protein RecN n=1 Tax=Janibacter sp. GXQ6167 TaxID=3240791 RepID=UPI0035262E3E
MLHEIHIRDLGVIAEARLDLHPGFTVVTGETGAGKTMVVSGLGLLFGARADAGLVRAGAERSIVEGVVELTEDSPALTELTEAGVEPEDGEVILARTLAATGRSRAHVGGRAAPVALLGTLSESLLAVHGQADQWRLRRPSHHRAVLDDFGGPDLLAHRSALRTAYEGWSSARADLIALRESERDRAQEVDLLTFQVEQIDRVEPQSGEDDELRAEEERLAYAEDLRAGAERARARLSDEDGLADAVALIAGARDELAALTDHDPQVADLHERLGELGVLANDLSGDLAGYAAGIEVDPARLAAVQQRRADLTELTRRYGEDIAAVLAHRERAQARLLELSTADDRLAGLDADVAQLAQDVGRAADELHSARVAAGERLAARITEELAHLGMPKAQVEIAVDLRSGDPAEDSTVSLPDGTSVEVGPDGCDEVEIRLAANRGSPARSVVRAASGGELSRVMLAIEVALAEAGTSVPTFVFDEVDAGVGGRAGLDVGARLAALARTSQVIVVTHLAQVAAHADRHLVVRKADDGQVTSSDVVEVTGEDRLGELARMMGGGDSQAALRHAAELVADCAADASSHGTMP